MRLPVGQSDFDQIIESDFYFVDKSLFVKDIILDDQIILITRPRRFGKTLNLSMLRYFFAPEVDGKLTRSLFNQLKISQEKAVCDKHQGKYAVISFSLKDIKAASFSKAYAGICEVIRSAYDNHRYLLTSEALSEEDRVIYKSILASQAKEIQIQNSLKHLVQYLYRHHQVKVVILIDEYNTPIQSGYLHDYYEEVMEFFRGFLGAALKDNKYIFKAILTGILRVAKENLFSGLNNLVTYSMLNKGYSNYFGFNESEVETVLTEADLESQLDEVKRWYNGYHIGDTTIYNPWSIASYIKAKEFKPYWVNTSDNALIKGLLTSANGTFKGELERLLKGGCIKHVIDDSFVFADLQLSNEATLWNLLFMSGYLKVDSCEDTPRGLRCHLSIPNLEVGRLYRKIIETWLAGERSLEWYDKFLGYLLEGNIALFSENLKSVMEQIISVHDTARDPEAFYHGLIVGLTASLHGEKDYELRSNRESGSGRYDYFIIAKNPDKLSILMEFKRAEEGNLDIAAKAALAQIDLNNYLAEAEQRSIKKLLKLGIAFSGKHFAYSF